MREIEESTLYKERPLAPAKLLYIPGFHGEELIRLGVLENEVSLFLRSYWYRVKEYIKLAVNFPGRIRLYLEGLHSPSEVRISNDEPIFGRFVERVKKAAELEIAGGQWSLSLPLLSRSSSTVVELAEDDEAYQQSREIIKQSLQLPDNDQQSLFWERNNEKFHRLQIRRDRFFTGAINSTLSPGEMGVLVLGAAHALQEEIKPGINIDIFEMEGVDPVTTALFIGDSIQRSSKGG